MKKHLLGKKKFTMALHSFLSNLGINDYLSLIGILLTIYVAQYYYKYFTRVNPLPGPFPFPFVGNLPLFLWHGGNIKSFFESNRKKYGDVFEVHLSMRRIILNRAEHIDKLLMPLTKSQYLTRIPYT